MQKLADLVNKEMTRKEFLATVGLGLAMIFGFGEIIKLFSKTTPSHAAAPHTNKTNLYGVAHSDSKKV